MHRLRKLVQGERHLLLSLSLLSRKHTTEGGNQLSLSAYALHMHATACKCSRMLPPINNHKNIIRIILKE